MKKLFKNAFLISLIFRKLYIKKLWSKTKVHLYIESNPVEHSHDN